MYSLHTPSGLPSTADSLACCQGIFFQRQRSNSVGFPYLLKVQNQLLDVKIPRHALVFKRELLCIAM